MTQRAVIQLVALALTYDFLYWGLSAQMRQTGQIMYSTSRTPIYLLKSTEFLRCNGVKIWQTLQYNISMIILIHYLSAYYSVPRVSPTSKEVCLPCKVVWRSALSSGAYGVTEIRRCERRIESVLLIQVPALVHRGNSAKSVPVNSTISPLHS